MKNLSDKVLEIASGQLGVEEEPKGSNSGPEVNQYLASVGLGKGNPWCMAFVYWCVNEAAKQQAVKNPLVKTGSVLDQWKRTKLRLLPARSGGIKPGDIFIMDFGGGKGHTGFIEMIENGIAHTIEGNTNDEGGREGYEVCRRQRTITSFKGVIQLP